MKQLLQESSHAHLYLNGVFCLNFWKELDSYGSYFSHLLHYPRLLLRFIKHLLVKNLYLSQKFSLLLNRVLNRGCLVYMFSLRFSGSKVLIYLWRQFRARKFFLCA